MPPASDGELAGPADACTRSTSYGWWSARSARLERGNLSGVSNSVLEALARALQLDEAERQHLFDLANAASIPASRSRPAKPPVIRIRPAVLSILNGMTGTPAYVRNARMDILAANNSAWPSTTAT